MFDGVVRSNLGCKILAGHLAICQLGLNQNKSVIAISQSLDKLVVHDFLSYGRDSPKLANNDDDNNTTVGSGEISNSPTTSPSVYYIAVKDVIKTVSVRSFKILFPPEADSRTDEKRDDINAIEASNRSMAVDEMMHAQMRNKNTIKDLLLIGCSNSVIIYDTFNQNNLLIINTPTSINAITNDVVNTNIRSTTNQLTVCGGLKRIYTLKLESRLDGRNINAELSSERSTSDTISCLVQGNLSGIDFVLTGSIEHKISVYQLDTFDQNIQTCKLIIEESSQVNCLCPINTIENNHSIASAAANENVAAAETGNGSLPPVSGQISVLLETNEQMNYFAYGLENGFIGVYRLFPYKFGDSGNTLSFERVWRHKCKHTPLTIMMYDINGDGLDEMVVGFKNSRLEARSPFTGQLLAATRCFKSDRLAGLNVIDYYHDGSLILIACSIAGSMIGFKPKLSRPRIPLQGYNLPANQMLDLQINEWANFSIETHTNGAVTNLKTIEEEQDGRSALMKGTSDLHIESQSDETKPSKCDARQCDDLLQRLNALQSEQIELERNACHIYHMNVFQGSKFYPSDVNIAYEWDFDLTTAYLRLTIVIITNIEDVELIKLEDDSRNFLTSGYLLMNPNKGECSLKSGKSHVIVIPLRSNRDVETKLNLKVFCETYMKVTELSSSTKVARVYNQSIDVPKFSMFTIATEAKSEEKSANVNKNIKMIFKLTDGSKVYQVLDWLNESFLCFQFGRLIKNCSYQAESASNSLTMSTNIDHPNLNILNSSENFQLNLLDIRYTLKKIAKEDNLLQANPDCFRSKETTGYKFTKLSSTLQISYSNGTLKLESESSDLMVDLVRSLVIDRLHLKLSSDELQEGEFVAEIKPILDELDTVTKESMQLKESEKRIQTELYESADYTTNLMQQFAIANELNEFTTAKELLNELFMMLNGVQNAARAHCLNNKSHLELSKQVSDLREKISFLSGQFT